MGDFTLDTKGCCFLCLIKVESGEGEKDEEMPSKYDMRLLAKYLTVDRRKVLVENENKDSQSGSSSLNSDGKLMVTMCEECSTTNDDFLDIYGQLAEDGEEDDNEETEMEMAYCLKLIHRKMTKTEETGRSKEFDGLEIAMTLRMEVMQKCFLIFNSIISGEADVNTEANEVFANKPQNVVSHIIRVKVEHPDSDSSLEDDDEVDEEDPPNDSPQVHEEVELKQDIDVDKDFTEVQVPVPKNQAAPTDDSSKYLLVLHTSSSLSTDETWKPRKDPKEGTYICPLCPKYFKYDIDATRHYQTIHLKMEYQCSLCKMVFKRQPSYYTHFRVMHQGLRWKCGICNKLFKEKSFMKMHLSAHAGRRLQCSFCPQTFKFHSCRSRHMLRRCPAKFGSKEKGRPSKTKEPQPETPKRKKKPNSVQDTSFVTILTKSDTPRLRQKDMSRFHEQTKKYQCVDCHRQYVSIKRAAQHYKGSHIQTRFQCQPCGKEFSSKRNCISHHNKTHIKREVEDAKCPTCDKVFSDKANLGRHQGMSPRCGGEDAARKKVCHCKLCGVGFTHKISLDKHMKAVHLKVRDHACHVCRHKFFAKDGLNRHMRLVHPYQEEKGEATQAK